MLLLIDNYDSFVYNLARYLQRLGAETVVVRNDEVSIEWIRRNPIEAIVLSPGPCTPQEAGMSLEIVQAFADHLPLLGVYLGHQTIAAAFGARGELRMNVDVRCGPCPVSRLKIVGL